MENKINIAKLLKDCPEGMELNCTMYDKVTLISVDNEEDIIFPIIVMRADGNPLALTKYGQYLDTDFAKCIIFPKGKATWEGFVPPCKFKNGDILYVDCTDENDCKQYDYILILDKIYNGKVYSYCHYYIPNDNFRHNLPVETYLTDAKYPIRLATEEEKQKLFDAIKENGYRWNFETKTLEKLIEPKFKVGDKIHNKTYKDYIYEVLYFTDKGYKIKEINAEYSSFILFEEQDNYELIPNKFDISTLKPFESKVLVRGANYDVWRPAIYGFADSNKYYIIGGVYWQQCIPYEANKELLGTTDNCNEYYKTWK